MLPKNMQPYAKTVTALVLALIGYAVSLGFFDLDTGAAITGAVTVIAVALGVYQVTNAPQQSEPRPSSPTTQRRG